MAQLDTAPTEQLITAEQARSLLGIGRNKMAALLADGTLPYRKSIVDGRVKLVKLEDVQRLQIEVPRQRAS